MKTAVEALRGVRHKLCMMGIELRGASLVYGDNLSVVRNVSMPESTLRKKSNSVCYHFVREAVARKELMVSHIPSISNPADICTKIIPGRSKRDGLIDMVLHDVIPS